MGVLSNIDSVMASPKNNKNNNKRSAMLNEYYFGDSFSSLRFLQDHQEEYDDDQEGDFVQNVLDFGACATSAALQLLDELPAGAESDDIRTLLTTNSRLLSRSGHSEILEDLDSSRSSSASTSTMATTAEEDSSTSCSSSSSSSSGGNDEEAGDLLLALDALNFPFDLFDGDLLDDLDSSQESNTMFYEALILPRHNDQEKMDADDSLSGTAAFFPPSDNRSKISPIRLVSPLGMSTEKGRLNMLAKLDECMKRTAASRSMVRNLMLPSLSPAAVTKSDDEKCKSLITSLPSTFQPEVTLSGSRSLLSLQKKILRRSGNRLSAKAKVQRKNTRRSLKHSMKKIRHGGDYVCSGVLLRAAPFSLDAAGGTNQFSSTRIKSKIPQPSTKLIGAEMLTTSSSDDMEMAASPKQSCSISAFLRQSKKSACYQNW